MHAVCGLCFAVATRIVLSSSTSTGSDSMGDDDYADASRNLMRPPRNPRPEVCYQCGRCNPYYSEYSRWYRSVPGARSVYGFVTIGENANIINGTVTGYGTTKGKIDGDIRITGVGGRAPTGTVTGAATISGPAMTTGPVLGTVSVSGTGNFDIPVNATVAIPVGTIYEVDNHVATFSGPITYTTTLTLTGPIVGNATVLGNASITGSARVSGVGTVNGPIEVLGPSSGSLITVSGPTTIEGNGIVSGEGATVIGRGMVNAAAVAESA